MTICIGSFTVLSALAMRHQLRAQKSMLASSVSGLQYQETDLAAAGGLRSGHLIAVQLVCTALECVQSLCPYTAKELADVIKAVID